MIGPSGLDFIRLKMAGLVLAVAVMGSPAQAANIGVVRLADINSGVASSSPTNLTDVNGTLFFAADDGISGVELWKSNGRVAGTVRVRDINPTGSSNPRG